MSLLWEKLARPLLFRMDAERAHEIGIKALKRGVASPFFSDNAGFGFGETKRFGLKFSNPLGMAAGFDKNGVVVEQLASLGFGFVEVGTVTFEPQPGNPKPRLFRLPKDRALINRLGFNNDGASVVAKRLSKIDRKCVVGVNIGKNKNVPNEEAVENYLGCFEIVHPVADFVAVNVSSPNTQGLRDLQQAENLDGLLNALQKRNSKLGRKPLLVKIAPDLSPEDIDAIVNVCLAHKIDGIIATNTTIGRSGLVTGDIAGYGDGGLSGRPLASRSDEVISQIFGYSRGAIPVIGVGGVFSGQDAFDKIAAGASLVQAYTGFVYGGPLFAKRVNSELAAILAKLGFPTIDDAIGSAAKV